MLDAKNVRCGFGWVGERGKACGSVVEELRMPRAAAMGGMLLSC